MGDLSDIAQLEDPARSHFDAKFSAREVGIKNSRQAIRFSANAIRSTHRGESEAATQLMEQAARLLAEARQQLADHPDILYAGFYADATKEYAEARLTAAIIAGEAVPSPEAINVEWAPYLNGLGEVVGELRRHLLDRLRSGEVDDAELILQRMSDVLDLLAGLDYPDGMTGGLRRTTDVARALIERSRADLTTTVVQERLITEIRKSHD